MLGDFFYPALFSIPMERLTIIKRPLTAMGRWVILPVQEMGRIAIFFFWSICYLFIPPFQVDTIRLDPVQQVAVITMKIDNSVRLTDDVIASVKTSGLIGDKYIALASGGSEQFLNPGDTIIDTESAVDLEELISKYVFGEGG